MIFCPICHSSMVHVRRFNPNGEFELDACRNCWYETTPKKVPKKISPKIYMQDNHVNTEKEKRIKKCIVRT